VYAPRALNQVAGFKRRGLTDRVSSTIYAELRREK
jgi:hypothetical protein